MEAPPRGNFLYDEVLPRVEFLNWVVTSVGFVLRYFFLVPGGDSLVMVGLGGLALAHFLGAFAPSTRQIDLGYPEADFSEPESFFAILLRYVQAFGSAAILFGILFKLLFWQGAAGLLTVGVVGLLVTAAWQASTGSLTRRNVLVIGLGIITWAVPTEALIQQLYRDDPSLVAKMVYQHHHPQDRTATEDVKRLRAAWHKRKH